jgi:dUTP pyrophosphatase
MNKKKMQVENIQLKIQRLSKDAILPMRATQGSAGYDLTSPIECNILPRSTCCVDLGMIIQIPDGHYGRIAPRSSLALFNAIDIGGGVIDCDYRGSCKVILFNHSNENYSIKRGDKIAQLILEKISTPDVIEIMMDEMEIKDKEHEEKKRGTEIIIEEKDNKKIR